MQSPLIKNIRISNTEVLGTAVEFTITVNPNDVTARLSITDVSSVIKVNNANMTKLADGVYNYVWQSDEDNDLENDYIVTFKITSGSYTDIKQRRFTLFDPEPEKGLI